MADEKKDVPIVGFFTDSAISGEESRGKANAKRRILPPQRPTGWAGRTLGAFQDLAIGAASGLQAAQGGISMGDPVVAAIQGAAGGIQAPSAHAIKERQFMEQIDSVPIDELSPELVARYPEIAGLPLGVVQKMLPVFERNERNEALAARFLAAEEGRESRFKRGVESREGARSERGESRKFDQALKLKKEYARQSKDYIDTRSAYSKLLSLSKLSGPGPAMAFIYNFQKLNDPGSVVRETEFKSAEQARAWLTSMDGTGQGGRVPSVVRQWINKADTGDFLLPEQRASFVQTAKSLYDTATEEQRIRKQEFTEDAEANDIDPMRVVGRLTEEIPESRSEPKALGGLTAEQRSRLEALRKKKAAAGK